MDKLRVAVHAATGMVGQRYVSMLEGHPFFKVTEVTGFESAGKRYGDALRSKGRFATPAETADLPVKRTSPDGLNADLVFSPLPTEVAGRVEVWLARNGLPVITDASPHRMDPDVPLLIPEVNPEHLAMLDRQKRRRRWEGFIAATPNCTAAGLALALKPIHDRFGLKRAVVVTMQAVSGAGYPGVPSIDIIDNVLPYIRDEEEKLETEPLKMLGASDGGEVRPARFRISATCHRVATTDGHMESVYLETKEPAPPGAVAEALRRFRAVPQRLRLPTAPSQPVIVTEQADRPQVRLDRDAGSVPGMSVVVGRIRRGLDANSVRLTFVSHNTVRGAAGSTILAAELMRSKGLFG